MIVLASLEDKRTALDAGRLLADARVESDLSDFGDERFLEALGAMTQRVKRALVARAQGEPPRSLL